MRHHRLTRSAALGLALVALAAPTPPHRICAALTLAPAAVAAPVQGLLSPDTRDATEGRGTFNVPEVAVVTLRQPAPAVAGGIDWSDAGIGAGSLLAVILLGLGSTLAVVHRRHGASARRSTATTG